MRKIIRFGIASVAEQRARSLAIATGKRARLVNEPKVWFPSVKAAARVLSDENMSLLKAIREQRPESMDALAKAVGKQAPNVSRSLHTLEQFGLVSLNKIGRTVVPVAMFERVTLDFV
jgi:predicted transcriptional regulator